MNAPVKILGRAVKDAEGTLWLGSAASEISFEVARARRLSFRLAGDGTCGNPDPAAQNIRPRYAVYLDGRRVLDERLNAKEKEIELFREQEPADHTVRLVKLSECSQSLMGVREILTDGVLSPLPEKALRLEFIGDSFTCGYGVEGKAEDHFSTATENAEKAYAFLTARALDADAVMTAISGCGLLSGYTEGDINEDNLMQPYYEKVGRNVWPLPDGRRLQEIPWDFASFRPDWILLHLGNNDTSWTRGLPEREAAFEEKYRAFLSRVRRCNPGARILCLLGVQGKPLTEAMQRAVAAWQAETKDPAVGTMLLPAMNEAEDGAGSDHHPSEITQKKLAAALTERLREELKSASR